jgi:hypothetical protein
MSRSEPEKEREEAGQVLKEKRAEGKPNGIRLCQREQAAAPQRYRRPDPRSTRPFASAAPSTSAVRRAARVAPTAGAQVRRQMMATPA